MKYLIAVSILAIAGCGVTSYKQAEFCEGSVQTIIGIPYNKSEQCALVNIGDSEGEMPIPTIVVPVQ